MRKGKAVKAATRRRLAAGAARPVARRRRPAAPRPALVPYLTVRGAAAAVDFYKRAFGAREVRRMPGPGNTLMHAEIRIGGALVFLSDEFPDWGSRGPHSLGGVTGSLHLNVKNVDAAVRRATLAGATIRMPPADMFWGDRYAKLVDPFGHEWGLAALREVVAPAELRRRAAAFAARMNPDGVASRGPRP